MQSSKKGFFRRMLAAALSTALAAGFLPVYVFADDSAADPEQEQIAETTVSSTAEPDSHSDTDSDSEDEKLTAARDRNQKIRAEEERQRLVISASPLPDEISSLYRIYINGQERIEVFENDNVHIEVVPTQQTEDRYHIVSLQIGEKLIEDAVGQESYDCNIPITKEFADANGEVHVAVDLSMVYIVTFSFDSTHGDIEPSEEFAVYENDDPTHTIGRVQLNHDERTAFSAIPDENYRVSSVTIDGQQMSFTENDYIYYSDKLEANRDHQVEVVFSLNRYTVTAEDIEHGRIELSSEAVDYGGTVHVTFSSEDEQKYYLNAVYLNDEPVEPDAIRYNNFELENITENMFITAEFLERAALSEKDYSWNQADALDVQNNTYTFSSGTPVVFQTKKEGIQLFGPNHQPLKGGADKKSVSFEGPEKVTVQEIQLYYSESDYDTAAWHSVPLKQPITLAFYEGVTVNMTLPELPAPYTSYSSDVRIELKKSVPDYSSITKMEYWIGDGSEHQLLDADADWITVPAEENNSQNIVVHLAVTDEQEHVTQFNSAPFSINTAVPVVSVKMNDDEETSAFNHSRTAVIEIQDRDYTFNRNAGSELVIKKDGAALSKDVVSGMVTWKENGDVLIGTIEFNQEGKYEWEFSYTNLAGLHNEGFATQNADSDFSFTIDKTAPNASVTIEGQLFDKLLDTLTFGICRASAFTVSVDVSDLLSEVQAWYYISNDPTPLRMDDLKSLDEDEWKLYVSEFLLERDDLYVVYVKAVDRAGNETYISSNGHIVDSVKPQIALTPQKMKGDVNSGFVFNNQYKKDGIQVTLSAIDSEVSSGLQKIEYWVTNNEKETQRAVLYQMNDQNLSYEALIHEWEGSFKVDADKNNSSNVMIYAMVTDRAGNSTVASVSLDINVSEPRITIAYDNYIDDNKTGYFKDPRRAVIQIVDRSGHFDAKTATDGIQIIAKDVHGKEIEIDRSQMISDWKQITGAYVATIDFTTSANYDLTVKYTNAVGNSALAKNSRFTVDTGAPSGSVSIDEDHVWKDLLKVLTFGFYTNEKITVKVESEDDISPTELAYYISNDENPIDQKKMDRLSWKNLTSSEINATGSFELSEAKNYVVYVRIMDLAGNCTYISSDGQIIDKTEPNAEIVLEPANENGIYNHDVVATITAKDAFPYSGIKTVEYWVEKQIPNNDTQEVTKEITTEKMLYEFDLTSPSYDDLVSEWTYSIIIDAEENNASDVTLWVRVTDNAGLSSVTSQKIDIDITAPSISVSYDNNSDNNGNTYFDDIRTATVVITERSQHFDEAAATAGIEITAVDAKGNKINNSYVISNWTHTPGATPDQDTHTATIRYQADANYTFDISYTDKAGNKNSSVETGKSVAPYQFTVDTVAPEGTITAKSAEGRTETWDSLIQKLSFGFWSNSCISISGTSDDATSDVMPIQYYKYSSTNATDATSALSLDELKAVTAWKTFEQLDVYPNEQFTVYFKIVDFAGNTTYISTNGLIVDDNAPIDEVTAPKIDITPEQTESGIYNKDVTVSVVVDDPMVGGTYSGLNLIEYRVLNMGDETQNGTLYSFTGKTPLQNELQKTWDGEITVSSELNNSNDVIIEVFAVDNAGNSSTESISVKIDITHPEIVVSYDNNTVRNNLFSGGRTATITIYERNFSDKYVNLTTTRNGSDYISSVAWSSRGGSGNGDDTAWVATVPFGGDGDYTFKISCTDLAANESAETVFAPGTVNGSAFTIDGTAPKITVTFADEDDNPNNKYYKGTRTATITITETHFDAATANNGIVITGMHDGTPVTVKASGFSGGNQVYTATAVFQSDAEYTMNVSYTDQAGNVGNSQSYNFVVDKVDPVLNVQVNEKSSFDAYKADVLPVISYHDVNFDPDQVSIELTGVYVKITNVVIKENEIVFTLENSAGKKVDWKAHIEDSEAHYGKLIVFDNFPSGAQMNGFDDIYTLTVSLTDKSGRTSTRATSFSVNRYGSTYDIDSVKGILGTYVHGVNGVSVIEVNPNELKEYSITLFKNNETIILKENEDYTVQASGKELEWHEYIYTINDAVFVDDGTYSLTIHSEDRAGNISENTLETKKSDISFGVDNTPPLAVVANIESGKTYNVESLDVLMTANDNLVLSSVEVMLDGQSLRKWNADQITEINRRSNPDERLFAFEVAGDSTDAHTLEIICYDAANNINEPLVIRGFYVTTDNWTIFRNWIKNHMFIFIGSIIALLALIGGGVYLLLAKKRRRTF